MDKWDIKERIRDRRGHSLKIDGSGFDKWENFEFIREAISSGTKLSIDLGDEFDKWTLKEIIREAGSSVSLSASMDRFDKWEVREIENEADDEGCDFTFY